MKYTKEQRLVIVRRVYDSERTRYEAAEEYKIILCPVFVE